MLVFQTLWRPVTCYCNHIKPDYGKTFWYQYIKKNLCWMRFYKIIMNEHMKSRFVTFFLSVLILPSLHCYTSYNMIYMSDWHWSWRSIFSCELFAHMEMSHVILVTHIPNIIHQKLKQKETILGWNYSFPSMPSNMANSMRES